MLWWIDEPLLRGSHNPTDAELTESRQGVATVVSLLIEAEQPPNYSAAHLESLGIKKYSVPVPDFTAPSVKQVLEVLEAVRVRSGAGQVLIHCQGGCGRTRTMAAAYWLSKSLAPDEAIRKVRNANRCAVETAEQEASVYKFSAALGKT